MGSSLPDHAARALGAVHLFPVRHHSPRSSAVLVRFLEQVRPKLVLVEGPEDAQPLLDVLLDRETRPPVAILGYRTDGTPGSVLYPMASYSPEYVALRWAREHDAQARFIDLTTSQSLAADRAPEEAEEKPEEGESRDAAAPPPTLLERLARARGFRSFEEFWEASFEAPAYDPDAFRAALTGYADLIRAEPGPEDGYHRARDAYMARRILSAVEGGARPEQIAVVAGAAHTAAFAALDVALERESALDPRVPSAVTLIPYSFTRLAEQTGYGAGNRAPNYYQRAHDAGCDFRRASLEVLIRFTDDLRLRGFGASLADTIEAYRLAAMLADIRGKSAPGLDEVREAAVATLCRGESAHVSQLLWPTVVGHAVGTVAARIGKNSLQEEFWREVEERRLPRTDTPERFVLKLNDPLQVQTSVFLHRLRIAEVPYAGFQGTRAGAGPRAEVEAAGGQDALSRVREGWEAQWTPATDVALVERIVLGDTLTQVCERTLAERLGEARSTGAVAELLMEAVVASAPEAIARALQACDGHAATDEDVPSLARACRALSGLVSYGSSREATLHGREVIPELCRKTFDRAVLRVGAACRGDDEAVAPVKDALRTLHEIALGQPAVDRASWLHAARELLESDAVHPTCAGLACGLLYLAQRLSEAEVAQVTARRLSNLLEPQRAAGFLEGFLEVNALVLVKSRPVVEALDAFLTALPPDRFRDTLPLLRRALGGLGATERRYLLENLLALRKLTDQARQVQQVMGEKDKAALEALGADVAKAMEDLDDLL